MNSLRITFVDDNQDLADALCLIAEFEGHEARAFYSAEELLAGADGFELDVYCLDIGLLGMTG